jgi:subtilisin family serine protease
MERARGSAEITIGLIDGPVATQHPDLAAENLREIRGNSGGACAYPNSAACLHGTFVAGILMAKRGSGAPAICPDCTLVTRPIFPEKISGRDYMPSASPQELAAAIIECIDAGARVINLSLALAQPSTQRVRSLEEALDATVKRGVLVIAAAGNQGTLGSSAITRHPWVIPVVACDSHARPVSESNLGNSLGKRGLMAPGSAITSLAGDGRSLTLGGTSVAAPFVTGAIALLWSEFPAMSAAEIKLAVTQASSPRRAAVVPRLLDAAAAYETLLNASSRRAIA